MALREALSDTTARVPTKRSTAEGISQNVRLRKVKRLPLYLSEFIFLSRYSNENNPF